jgi:hypothetical protein
MAIQRKLGGITLAGLVLLIVVVMLLTGRLPA